MDKRSYRDSFVLWGDRIGVGDAVTAVQEKQLQIIAERTEDQITRQIIGNILEKAGSQPTYRTALAAVESEAVPAIPADEATVRAREAFIATGEMPGIETAIRRGDCDDLIGIRTAIQVQIGAGQPVSMEGHSFPTLEPRFFRPQRRSMWSAIAVFIARQRLRIMQTLRRIQEMRDANEKLSSENGKLAIETKRLREEVTRLNKTLVSQADTFRTSNKALENRIYEQRQELSRLYTLVKDDESTAINESAVAVKTSKMLFQTKAEAMSDYHKKNADEKEDFIIAAVRSGKIDIEEAWDMLNEMDRDVKYTYY